MFLDLGQTISPTNTYQEELKHKHPLPVDHFDINNKNDNPEK